MQLQLVEPSEYTWTMYGGFDGLLIDRNGIRLTMSSRGIL